MSKRPQFEGADCHFSGDQPRVSDASRDAALLDELDITALQQFFALLDEWDKKNL